jgi:hypothetical protein
VTEDPLACPVGVLPSGTDAACPRTVAVLFMDSALVSVTGTAVAPAGTGTLTDCGVNETLETLQFECAPSTAIAPPPTAVSRPNPRICSAQRLSA